MGHCATSSKLVTRAPRGSGTPPPRGTSDKGSGHAAGADTQPARAPGTADASAHAEMSSDPQRRNSTPSEEPTRRVRGAHGTCWQGARPKPRHRRSGQNESVSPLRVVVPGRRWPRRVRGGEVDLSNFVAQGRGRFAYGAEPRKQRHRSRGLPGSTRDPHPRAPQFRSVVRCWFPEATKLPSQAPGYLGGCQVLAGLASTEKSSLKNTRSCGAPTGATSPWSASSACPSPRSHDTGRSCSVARGRVRRARGCPCGRGISPHMLAA